MEKRDTDRPRRWRERCFLVVPTLSGPHTGLCSLHTHLHGGVFSLFRMPSSRIHHKTYNFLMQAYVNVISLCDIISPRPVHHRPPLCWKQGGGWWRHCDGEPGLKTGRITPGRTLTWKHGQGRTCQLDFSSPSTSHTSYKL